ncbi:type I-B CRISPR-associated protein Cas5b [Halococcoides cellulosivorans]|uniref:Type I-B CRISPR-associated protein Cas5 n=1 Tax=Halococcoides cellulosivorans TaxID=1679096 RepID=A0A2R4WYU7_9EURY|nr:type I-B CRISPR-associated protein Cas5b [Halococcoides cellulosivorans]AWB26696.1 type I-B CRISPR-associated protein Cas5 [Halococcoides cellulosivorans]
MTQTQIKAFDNKRSEFRPENCIGFTVTSGFAHFKKVGNNSAKPTYRIPPRTTLAGLLAGILGYDRDSYYDLFQPENSAVSVVPLNNPHTVSISNTTVNTKADEAIKYIPPNVHYTKGVEALTPESYVELDRQRDPYEMLVDPVYRVYVSLADRDVESELFDRLAESRYHYSPSLGLSECLAKIDDVERHSLTETSGERIEIDSTVCEFDESTVVPEPEVTVRRERSPLYMEATEGGGRRTTAFGNVTYTVERDRKITVKDRPAYDTGRHIVSFS